MDLRRSLVQRVTLTALRLAAGAWLAALMLGGAGGAWAAVPESASPRAAVVSAIDEAVSILHNASKPVAQRRRELRALAQRDLDLAGMSAQVLGKHWTEMTAAQQREFVPLFEAFIESAYLGEIQHYSKLNIQVGAAKSESPNYASVNATVLQPGEDPIDVKFLLERAPSGWLVYDVVVDDIGMVENYRAQFDRIIRTRGLSRLEAELRIKQAKLDAMLGN